LKNWFSNIKITQKVTALSLVFTVLLILIGLLDMVFESPRQVMIGVYVFSVLTCLATGLLVSGNVTKSFARLSERFENLFDEKFTQGSNAIATNDEPGILITSLNKTVNELKEFFINTHSSADKIYGTAKEINVASEQTAEGAQQAALSITQLALGAQEQAFNVSKIHEYISEMDNTIESISRRLTETVRLSEETTTKAKTGQKKSENAVEKISQIKNTFSNMSKGIKELGVLSSEIEQIVVIIKNIASQTSLLALNAAIEAARAGEHGRGFAVVADEVKKLAEESSKATEKINEMICLIQEKTRQTVSIMDDTEGEVDEGAVTIEETGDALKEIHILAGLTNRNIDNISVEVERLSGNSAEVLKMAENISIIAEQSALNTQEIASIAEEQTAGAQGINESVQNLGNIAKELKSQLERFKL